MIDFHMTDRQHDIDRLDALRQQLEAVEYVLVNAPPTDSASLEQLRQRQTDLLDEIEAGEATL